MNKCFWNEEYCVDVKLEYVVLLVEFLFINCIEKLDKIVLLLDECYFKFKIEDLIVIFFYNSNVIIVLIFFIK